MVGNTEVTLKEKNVKVNNSTKASSAANTSNFNNKSKTMVDQNKGEPIADGALINKKSRS